MPCPAQHTVVKITTGKGCTIKAGLPGCSFELGKGCQAHYLLVQKGRYLTEQEQAQYDKIQAEKELAEEDAIQAQQTEVEEEIPKPTLRGAV